MREETQYNIVVSTNDNEITVLRKVLKYSDGSKAITGATFQLISKKELKERTTINAIADHLESCVNEDDIPHEYKYTQSGRLSKNPYKAWAKAIKNNCDAENVMFDTSFIALWDTLDKFLGIEGGFYNRLNFGRIFSKDSVFNEAPELQHLINEYED